MLECLTAHSGLQIELCVPSYASRLGEKEAPSTAGTTKEVNSGDTRGRADLERKLWWSKQRKTTQEVVSNRKLTVRDLDQTITGHEIREAVNAAVGSPDRSTEAIQVSGLKKPQGGMLGMATLHLSDTDKDKLLERGKIRIGWNQCRVQEIVGPAKCFQCLQFGHIASRCRQSLFPLRKGGPSGKNCVNDPWCYVCMVDQRGHEICKDGKQRMLGAQGFMCSDHS
ncbi:hypothetical protein MTP99_006965 [Tenebrio molitor]|jgi:hypothetical protein|nr:hypothetical protein MTP99_006965 [Tenebrio molitor]